jgi:hypothetical protein
MKSFMIKMDKLKICESFTQCRTKLCNQSPDVNTSQRAQRNAALIGFLVIAID